MRKIAANVFWFLLAVGGAWAYATLAFHRGEPLNSAYILIAALCTYAIGYRFYSRWIAVRVLMLDDRRATPCEVHDDGKDFCRTNRWIVFGHHFAAISGPGPLVGPVLASQFGYLPGTLWILIGVVLGGAVQDFVILFCSLRRNGKSLGQMVKEELNSAAGFIALLAILAILVILLAVLALVVVRALAESPWGIFTVGATIPIAMLMGGYMRFWRVGKVLEASAVGVVLPTLHMPALTSFGATGDGPVFAGKLFPFCFITIACGAISGFHTLIASGTTPKIISRETHARTIGYGAMCLESLVAIMALIAACTLDPGVYLSMNVKGEAAATAAKMTSLGFPVSVEHMNELAGQIGEKSLFGRVGGAPTLAVGMASIFSKAVGGRWLDLWYHFAIMFEALFILTTIDAGTRAGRYLLQDLLGHVWKPLGDTRSLGANFFASVLLVSAWGYFLIQGVRDPLGGINSLWPLFGIANQMLAAIALCLATTVILKMTLGAPISRSARTDKQQRADQEIGAPKRSPWFALVTLIPLVWLLAVTFTAGVEKIWHPDPKIGFLAQAHVLALKQPDLERAVAIANQAALKALFAKTEVEEKLRDAQNVGKAAQANRTQRFNNLLDAGVAGAFLGLVSIIVLISIREWILLLARRKIVELRETPPVWLPDYAVAACKPLNVFGLFALAFALARELSGEAQLERARHPTTVCEVGPSEHAPAKSDAQIYLETTEKRFTGVNRCC